MKRLVSGFPIFFFAAIVLAQSDTTPHQLTDKQAAGLLAGICGLLFIPMLISVGLWLGIAIWVTKDASRRESPNAVLVTVLAWIPATSIIGLIIHLVTRPKNIPGAPSP